MYIGKLRHFSYLFQVDSPTCKNIKFRSFFSLFFLNFFPVIIIIIIVIIYFGGVGKRQGLNKKERKKKSPFYFIGNFVFHMSSKPR